MMTDPKDDNIWISGENSDEHFASPPTDEIPEMEHVLVTEGGVLEEAEMPIHVEAYPVEAEVYLENESPSVLEEMPVYAAAEEADAWPNALEQAYKKPKPGAKRRRLLIYAVVAVVLITVMTQVPVVGDWVKNLFFSQDDTTIMTAKVEQGVFIHEVTVRGDISSSSNINIKCDVANPGGTMILEVIPEGAYVKAGDKLVVLDSTTFVDQINSQQISCSNSAASLKAAEDSLETAKIALHEYEEGSYKVSLMEYNRDLVSATEEFDRQEERLIYSRKLYEKGFITEQEMKAEDYALKSAEIKLAIAKKKIEVLNNSTYKKNMIQYQSNITTAEANVEAKKQANNLDLQKLEDLKERKENCTIYSPQDGQVIYANETDGRAGTEFIVQEGVSVRERQTIIRLPDPQRLQVTADVHEGRINHIKTGMTATLRVDALPTEIITGVVEKVNEFPQPTNHWMGNVKEYRVTIKVNPRDGLRPGMTAETRILVDKQDDVLLLPKHCIFTSGGKKYAVTHKKGVWEKHELKCGADNEKSVIVLAGANEGDEFVCGAKNYRDKVETPEEMQSQPASAILRSTAEELDATKKEADTIKEKLKQDGQEGGGHKRGGQGMQGMPEGFDPANLTPEQREQFRKMRNAAKARDEGGDMPGGMPFGEGGPPPPPPGGAGGPPPGPPPPGAGGGPPPGGGGGGGPRMGGGGPPPM